MCKIKICGITNLDDAKAALELGADALGFNFYKASPRAVSPAQAQAIVRQLPPSAWFVGVFVNATRGEIEDTARQVGLDSLQFHGDEEPEQLEHWREWRVIKALRLDSEGPAPKLLRYHDVVDYFVLDRYDSKQYGGTGELIDQSALERPEVRELLPRAFLAGGLTPVNVAKKVAAYRPFGVDVSSGVEIAPGKKSYERMKAFIEAVRGKGPEAYAR